MHNLLQTDISQCCYRSVPISLSSLLIWSSLGAELRWHRYSNRWFPAPNAALTAWISPVGFHRTKESCQRPWQCVTSPSATAVMLNPPFTTSPPPLPSLVWAEDFLPEHFKLSFFLNTHIKAGSGGRKKTDVSLMPFYSEYNEALEERERGWKDVCWIFLQSTSFLLTTGNTSLVLMQY